MGVEGIHGDKRVCTFSAKNKFWFCKNAANSRVEGWHLGVTALFQGSHPSIHTFLEKIQLDSYNQKFNILKASSGTINLSRKKYRDLNEKVQQITSSYTDSNLLSYIRSLAHLTY